MQITTYKCDRCGYETTDCKEQTLQRVSVGVGQYYSDYQRRGGVEWCKKCRIEVGLNEPDKKLPDVKPIDPTPTLEDLIRMIVRDEIQGGY